MNRRSFLFHLMAAVGFAAAGSLRAVAAFAAEKVEKIMKDDKVWKSELTPEQYDVLRHEGTERPFTSSLLDEHRKGVFVCAACGLELFDASTKFDSGTGWPSFYQAMPEHVETSTDTKLVMPRTEYHCARCGGHQGHVFNDGPQPTGLRYCNNGVALKFVPKDGKS
jgi:peptide-methionine (R)-S-oxide reductase